MTDAADDQLIWRDLNRNGVMDPFEDPRLTAEERTEDLLGRLSLAEKAGLLFQNAIETAPGGAVLEGPGETTKEGATALIIGKNMNHFNVHGIGSARETARWSNAIQRLAEQTPHGIPVTISTDPRHAFQENIGASFSAGCFSQWPETLGLAALDDEDIARFADIARQEYVALGIRAALHPMVDLATEPRWGRQISTFGANAERTTRALDRYLHGFQGDAIGSASVACVTKHFPGGGPQLDGEDAHFPYGREQVYPGGRFEDHLMPFLSAIEGGTAGMMPYYGMPVGLELDGEDVEEVGFGYNKQILTGLLRHRLGFDGVIVTDWELINDKTVGDQVLPARAWGVEGLTPSERMVKILDAGADQFGGEQCPDVLIDLVERGIVPESRVDESARRLLLVKFRLGLFDDPFLDEDEADAIVNNPDFAAAGLRAQAESVTVLTNSASADGPTLPLRPTAGLRVYVEGISAELAAQLGEVVDEPRDADVAIVRLEAPWEHRDDLFLERYFHQGSLDFPPGLVSRLARIAADAPLIVDVMMDRPAIVTPLIPFTAAITVTYGTGSAAYIKALTGEIPPRGRLPFEIPRDMDAVRANLPDVSNDTRNPLFPMGHGLTPA